MSYEYRDRNRDDRVKYYFIRIFVSTFVILISCFVLYILYDRVINEEWIPKISISNKKNSSLTERITTEDFSTESMFVTDENGIRYRKDDKSFARDEWIDKNGELFYFDTNSYGKNGDMKLNGQVYSFTDGKLKSIKRDTAYVHRANDDYFSSIESSQYLVYLDGENEEKGYYAIKYKLYSDDTEDYLGTANDKQYSSPNMLTINLNYIYYLSVGSSTKYAGKLYRMVPNAEHKETVGTKVEGYIVLSDEVVYYCTNGKIMKANNWSGVSINILTEDESLFNDLSELKLIEEETTKETEEETTKETVKETKKVSETKKQNTTNKATDNSKNIPSNQNVVEPVGPMGGSTNRNSVVDGKPQPSTEILAPISRESTSVSSEENVRIGVAPGAR